MQENKQKNCPWEKNTKNIVKKFCGCSPRLWLLKRGIYKFYIIKHFSISNIDRFEKNLKPSFTALLDFLVLNT
jgi:hypothetical protein